MNGDPDDTVEFKLPDGKWEVVVDGKHAGMMGLRELRGGGSIQLAPSTGMVLREKL